MLPAVPAVVFGFNAAPRADCTPDLQTRTGSNSTPQCRDWRRPRGTHRRTAGGDPEPGGPTQIVGRSAVRPGKCPFWTPWHNPDGRRAAAVEGCRARLAAATGGGGGTRGVGRSVLVPAVACEGADGPVEPVARRAPDHHAFQRPVGRAQSEPAPHFGGKPASDGAFLVKVGRAVQERYLSSMDPTVRAVLGRRVALSHRTLQCQVSRGRLPGVAGRPAMG